MRDLVANRLGDLGERLAQLTALRGELRRLLASWDRRLAGTPQGRPAHLLQTLAGNETIARPPRRRFS